MPAISRYRDKLTADLMVILDGPQHPSGRPTIAYGARGIARVDITVFGPRVGVHSGNYGNWIPNPAQRLASLLASMKDDDGKILVEGWNQGIEKLTPEEQTMLADVPEDGPTDVAGFRRGGARGGLSPAAGRAAVSDAQRPRPGELRSSAPARGRSFPTAPPPRSTSAWSKKPRPPR